MAPATVPAARAAALPAHANVPVATGAAALAPRALLAEALCRSATRHERLCPRQVLGVRMGFAGAEALGFVLPDVTRNLLAFVETDGCFVDGIEAATGCSVGHRTLRVEDLGKVAATFVDATTGQAVRVAPAPGVRGRAFAYAPSEARRYYAQLTGYQRMPAAELLVVRAVVLTIDLATLLGHRATRVECAGCGEEILNGRELLSAGGLFCRPCIGSSYYERRTPVSPTLPA